MFKQLRNPIHPNSLLPAWLVICLFLVALVNLYRIAVAPVNVDTPIDFKPVYVGQKMLMEGKNPYPDSLLKESWKEIVINENIVSNRMPGQPLTFLLYPPHSLFMLGFLSLLPYKIAFILWYLSLPLLLSAMLYFITKTFSEGQFKVMFFDLLLLALAFKGTISAMLVGQPTFLSLAICFAGLYSHKTGRKVLAGILLGLGTFKITLVMPFVLFLLFKKEYKVLLIAGITGILLIGGSALWINNPEVFHGNFANIEAQRAWIYDSSREGYPLNYEMITFTEIGVLAEFFKQGANRYISILNAVLIILVLAFLFVKNLRRPLDDLFLFVVLCLLMLLSTYHLFYDCLLLLPMYFLWPRLTPNRRLLVFTAATIWFVPVNGILNKLTDKLLSHGLSFPSSLNILYFTLPVSLLLLMAVLLTRPVYQKPATVNPDLD